MPMPQPRTQPPASNRRNFADIAAGRALKAPLNQSAMEFFKLLLGYVDDQSIDFDLLLDAVRAALPALNTTNDQHEKAVILLKFYNNIRINRN
ncbi:hypothetical protein CEXT_566941 [Caerostris extrusa]|uniref:Uncharacterized protein n=1 Tax=Caerostris extrusa TaxID=172846 RepID=A0AAV4SEW4_CAEEX|nr:hypothetical protein CEXT_566941 [Caerostris extrusa]